MNHVFVILDELFDQEEKKELMELQRHFDFSGLAIYKSTDSIPFMDMLIEACSHAEYIFFSNHSVFKQCNLSEQFIDDLLKNTHKTGYFLDDQSFIGEKNTLPTEHVAVFSRHEQFYDIVKKGLGNHIELDIVESLNDYSNIDSFIQRILKDDPLYVVFDINFIMDEYEKGVELLTKLSEQRQHIWVPQLDFDSRIEFAKETLEDIESNYRECESAMKPTMMS